MIIFIITKILYIKLCYELVFLNYKKETMILKNSPINPNMDNNQFPNNLRGFSKDPIKELLFLVLIAISYLYIDIKVTNEEIQEKQNKKIELLEDKVEELTQQLRKSESELSAASSKIRVLQDLGKIR